MKRNNSAIPLLVGLGLLVGACGASVAATEPEVASLPAESSAADTTSTEGGADNDASDADAENSKEIDPETAQLQYSQCLEEFGVEDPFADSEEGGMVVFDAEDDSDFAKFQEADEECGKILEDAFGSFEVTPEQEAEFKDAELQFNTCMTEKGFDMGSGDSGDSSNGQEFSIELDADADISSLEEAFKECDAALEAFGDEATNPELEGE